MAREIKVDVVGARKRSAAAKRGWLTRRRNAAKAPVRLRPESNGCVPAGEELARWRYWRSTGKNP